MVGFNTGDDCAVYRLRDDLAIIQTVDFFTPIVDDPYDYGAIAAANALSDVYAMGAKPLFALNIVGFPAKGISMDVLAQILEGGAAKVGEAGIEIVGGHTVDDREPKYGLAVTGVIDPAEIVYNSTAQVDDVLFLTKPLGIGIITTAIKRGLVDDDAAREAVAVMGTLNLAASQAMVAVGVSACTDVTGYGMLGHLGEMTRGSGVGARIRAGSVPVLGAARNLVEADTGIAPGGTVKNLDFADSFVEFDPALSRAERLLLADAQTSGGLLISCPPARADDLEQALREAGGSTVARIGEIHTEDDRGRITVVP